MTVGTSDRRQFPDEMSYLLGGEDKGESDGPITQKTAQYTGQKDWDKGNWNETWEDAEGYQTEKERQQKILRTPPDREFFDRPDLESPGQGRGLLFYRTKKGDPVVGDSRIDRKHHVPLVASALTDEDGQMYGMAIDHRIPSKPEYEKHLWEHESKENDYMNDLVKIGYSSQDAYHKAHDWSTARESAAVEAEFGKQGLEDYKQHWRNAASIAAEPTDRERHPDAHTTKHGLDEAELGQKFAQLQANYETPQEQAADYRERAKEQLGGGALIEDKHKPFHPLSILGAPPIMDLSVPGSLPGVQQIDTGLQGNAPIQPKFFKKGEHLSDEIKPLEKAQKEAEEGPEEKGEPPEGREMEDTLELPEPEDLAESMKKRFERMHDLIERIRVRPIESGGRIRHKKRAVN